MSVNTIPLSAVSRCTCGASFSDEQSLRRHLFAYGHIACRIGLRKAGVIVPEYGPLETAVVLRSLRGMKRKFIAQELRIDFDRVTEIVNTFGG